MKKTFLAAAVFLTVNLFASSILLDRFFNDNRCDQILRNDGYFKTCYDYDAKGAKYVAYTLYGDKVNAVNIKKRPRFYEDLHIPKRYRSRYSDYTHNVFKADRGHLANDAAFDWSRKSLHAVYVMSNIIPQHYTLNRSKKAWAGVERYARAMAVKLGEVNVLNGVVYPKRPKRIGRDKIAVPSAFWKMIYNDDKDFRRCFYFENKPEVKGKRIKDYEIDCARMLNPAYTQDNH